jgi:hypothetical protein
MDWTNRVRLLLCVSSGCHNPGPNLVLVWYSSVVLDHDFGEYAKGLRTESRAQITIEPCALAIQAVFCKKLG